MRKVIVVKNRPVFVIAEIPQLPKAFIPCIRSYVCLERIAKQEKEKPPKEQDAFEQETSKYDQPRTIPEVRIPFWYRIKAALKYWYYAKHLPRSQVGRWAA